MELKIIVTITNENIEEILKIFNTYDCEDNLLIIKEIEENEALRNYFFSEDYAKYGTEEPFEYWNNDGWCYVSDVRANPNFKTTLENE